MRTLKDIEQDIATIEPPRSRWTNMRAVSESLAASLAWREAHPAESARLDALYAEHAETERHERECAQLTQLARQAEALLERAGVGERSREAAKAPQATDALLKTRAWLDGAQTWLLLAGDVGTGKTIAAAWAVRERLTRGESAAFRSASTLMRMSGFDEGAVELERMKRVGLLVLDDFGGQPASTWSASMLHELLDARHENRRRTIITANIKKPAAQERLGDRLLDRIVGDGRVVWLAGASLRRSA